MNNEAIIAYNKAILKQESQKIQRLLSANNMNYDFDVNSTGFIEITVTDGDWKHDHLALKNVMKKAGYILFKRFITDESNGDDSFSAIYTFR